MTKDMTRTYSGHFSTADNDCSFRCQFYGSLRADLLAIVNESQGGIVNFTIPPWLSFTMASEVCTQASCRLRSHCTIFCKRVNARAEIRHTDPLECSDCKILACGKSLLMRKSLLVSKQITYTRVQAKYIVTFSFHK